jgi:hypothetical protein
MICYNALALNVILLCAGLLPIKAVFSMICSNALALNVMLPCTGSSPAEAVFSAALSRALCFIHKLGSRTSGGPSGSRSRILCLQGSPDAMAHYIPIMNAIFSAQVRLGASLALPSLRPPRCLCRPLLCLQGLPDAMAHHISIMNAIFSAQMRLGAWLCCLLLYLSWVSITVCASV